MPTEVDNQLQRLNQARQKAEELSKEKSRLEGELDSHRKRLVEEEEKCLKEFECGVGELPALIDSFKAEAENNLAKAEVILGLREEEVVPVYKQPEVEIPIPARLTVPTAPNVIAVVPKTPMRKVIMPKGIVKDDDGI